MDYFKLFIPYFAAGNVNCAEIARNTGNNERLVQRYYKKYRLQQPIPPKIKIGRPPKFSGTINTRIGQMVKSKPLITSNEIASKLNEKSSISISARTVRRKLKVLDYDCGKPKVVPLLTDTHVKKRLEFYEMYKNLDWKTVIFSDESVFQLSPNIIKCWSKKGQSVIVPRKKYDDKVMVWGAFSFYGSSELHLVDGILNGVGYTGVLDSTLEPFILQKHRNYEYFQQDNAPCHTCRHAKEYFAQKKIEILTWPANSPDLNPIENLWGILKIKVARRCPKTKNELKSILNEEWKKITDEIRHNLVNSMPKRLEKLRQKMT